MPVFEIETRGRTFEIEAETDEDLKYAVNDIDQNFNNYIDQLEPDYTPKNDDDRDGWLKRKLKSYGSGVASMISGAGGALRAVTGDNITAQIKEDQPVPFTSQYGVTPVMTGIEKKTKIKSVSPGKVISDFGKEMQKYYEVEDPTFIDEIFSGLGSASAFITLGIATSMMSGSSLAGIGLSTLLESSVESGNTFEEVFDKTGDRNEALKATGKSFAANMVVNASLNKFGELYELTAKKGLKGIAKGAFGEGVQEFLQEYISQAAPGDENPFTYENLKRYSKAGLLGAIIGTGFATIESLSIEEKSEISKRLSELGLNESEINDILKPEIITGKEGGPYKGVITVPSTKKDLISETGVQKFIESKPEESKQISDLDTISRRKFKEITGIEEPTSAKERNDFLQMVKEMKNAEETAQKTEETGSGEELGGQEETGVYLRDTEQNRKTVEEKVKTTEQAQLTKKDLSEKVDREDEITDEYNVETEPEKDLAYQYEKEKDRWQGKKDVRDLKTKVEKRLLQKEILNVLGKKRYDIESQEIDQAIKIYIDSKRNPEHITKKYDRLTDEQKKIVDLSQNLPEEIKAIADKIAQSYEKIGAEALSEDVIKNVMDNFIDRIWDIEGKQPTEGKRKFGIKSRHAKQRKFQTIIEGWAAGYDLKVKGATNSLEIYKNEIINAIEDKKFIKSLSKLKTIDGQQLLSSKQFKGYDKVEHPNFKLWKQAASVNIDTSAVNEATGLQEGDWVKAGDRGNFGKVVSVNDEEVNVIFRNKAKGTEKTVTFKVEDGVVEGNLKKSLPSGQNFFIDNYGNVMERQELYAPKEVAKNLNNMLGTSKLYNIPGVKTITKYNALIKSWILQSSLFHHQAYMRSYWLGIKGSEINFMKAYEEGLKSIEQSSPVIERLVKNGLTLGLKQEWSEDLIHEKTIIGKVLDKLEVTKAVKDKIIELRDRQANFLFGEFGAGLKAKAAMIEYSNMLREHPDMDSDQVAKMVANLMNDDFGGLHLKRMGRNPTLQHFWRLFLLAPDWTESNIRTMVKAVKAGGKTETNFYRRFWTNIATKSIVLTGLANLLMAAFDEDDKEAKGTVERFIRNYQNAWKEGKLRWTGVDITPLYKLAGGKTKRRKYFSIIGHFADVLKFIAHPLTSAHHKQSYLSRTIFESLSGTDWAQRRFTTLPELLGVDKEKGRYKTFVAGKHGKGQPKWGKLKGQTVTFRSGKKGPLSYDRIPSYLISQVKGAQPVQVQNLISWILGEMEGFDALLNSAGIHISSTYEKPEKKKKSFKKR